MSRINTSGAARYVVARSTAGATVAFKVKAGQDYFAVCAAKGFTPVSGTLPCKTWEDAQAAVAAVTGRMPLAAPSVSTPKVEQSVSSWTPGPNDLF